MVGSSSTPEDRVAQQRLMHVSFVVIIGGSSGLIALNGNATLTEIGVVAVTGVIVGAILTWYLKRMVQV